MNVQPSLLLSFSQFCCTGSSLFSADMITMYTMIVEDNELSLYSHFYHVQVGRSSTSQKALFALNAYCKANNYYFARRSETDAQFRLRIAESLGVKVYELPSMLAKVETLVSYLRQHGQLPWKPADSANYRQMKAKISPSFYLFHRSQCLKRDTL